MMNRNRQETPMPTIDYGPEPFIANINENARRNQNFRTTQWTGNHLQLTMMSIPAGGEIGLEIHPDTDQFLYIIDGNGLMKMGSDREKLNYQGNVRGGFAIFVPAGIWHNLINTGSRPIKLSTVYAPPHHPHGTVHKTKDIADADEMHH